jgi:hypothetical protein
MRLWKQIGILGLAGGLAGCLETSPSTSDQLLNAVIASVAAEGAAQNVEMMHGPGGPHGFGFGIGMGPGVFECNAGARDGMTVTRTCEYRDGGGNLQTAYDPVTTASMKQHVELNGTMDRGFMSGTMQRIGDMTVTGLAGTETQITWNGTGSEKSSRVRHTDAGTSVQFDLNSTEVIANVVVPVPRTETSWPLSGTITRNVTVKFTGGEKDGTTEKRTVTITFDGTQFAKLTVNGETFQFDLAQRGRPGPMGNRPPGPRHP